MPAFVGFPGFVFFGEIDAEDDADNDGGNNNADDAERIGAGISHRNVRSLPALTASASAWHPSRGCW